MILFVLRDPKRGGTSVEEIYMGLINELKIDLDINVYYYNDNLGFIRNINAISKFKADIVHITSDVYHIIPFLGKTKKIITIHDIGRFKELSGLKKGLYKWLWFTMPAKFADKIITVSDYTSRDVMKYIGTDLKKKIIRIYNPLPRIFISQPKDINTEHPVILQVGTLSYKNIERVIEALINIPCHFVIIGKLSPHQIQLLKKNRIRYSNYSGLDYTEVYDHYTKSDIVMFVSLHEGFGMPIIEANATGRPVISASNSSLPEIANDAALLVQDVTSVDEIRSKIVLLLNDHTLRNNLIKNGYRNAGRFEMAEIVRQYREVYESIH